jgi:hypothetical protein
VLPQISVAHMLMNLARNPPAKERREPPQPGAAETFVASVDSRSYPYPDQLSSIALLDVVASFAGHIQQLTVELAVGTTVCGMLRTCDAAVQQIRSIR